MELVFPLAFAALLIGLSKGGLGGPIPVSFLAPFLSLFMPIGEAIGIVLPLLLIGDAIALYFYWQAWDMRYIRLLVPASVLGVAIGSVLLGVLDAVALKRIIGLCTLLAALYKLFGARLMNLTYQPRDWHGQLAGGISGFASALANAGAPAFTAYMLFQPSMSPKEFLGTTTLFFAIVNFLKIPGFVLSGVLSADNFGQILIFIPLVPFGVWLGRKLALVMNPQLFERIMLVLLFIISVWLLVS
jgi:uncharacterized protein